MWLLLPRLAVAVQVERCGFKLGRRWRGLSILGIRSLDLGQIALPGVERQARLLGELG
jgi:hypothetical protein